MQTDPFYGLVIKYLGKSAANQLSFLKRYAQSAQDGWINEQKTYYENTIVALDQLKARREQIKFNLACTELNPETLKKRASLQLILLQNIDPKSWRTIEKNIKKYPTREQILENYGQDSPSEAPRERWEKSRDFALALKKLAPAIADKMFWDAERDGPFVSEGGRKNSSASF